MNWPDKSVQGAIMKVVRRFVLIQGKTLSLYVEGKKKAVWDWVDDEDSLEELLKTVEYCRTFVLEAT